MGSTDQAAQIALRLAYTAFIGPTEPADDADPPVEPSGRQTNRLRTSGELDAEKSQAPLPAIQRLP
jgi:hypothetical protein